MDPSTELFDLILIYRLDIECDQEKRLVESHFSLTVASFVETIWSRLTSGS